MFYSNLFVAVLAWRSSILLRSLALHLKFLLNLVPTSRTKDLKSPGTVVHFSAIHPTDQSPSFEPVDRSAAPPPPVTMSNSTYGFTNLHEEDNEETDSSMPGATSSTSTATASNDTAPDANLDFNSMAAALRDNRSNSFELPSRPFGALSASTNASPGPLPSNSTAQDIVHDIDDLRAQIEALQRNSGHSDAAQSSNTASNPSVRVFRQESAQTSHLSPVSSRGSNTLRSAADRRYASRQTRIGSMGRAEHTSQDNWAREQIGLSGHCPMGFTWRRVDPGYHCRGGLHLITDELLAEGRRGIFVIQNNDINVRNGPWYHFDSRGRAQGTPRIQAR